jgi:hypothetical protein
MGAPTNNKQVLRDYRLALYQEQLGTVDLVFEDERNGSDETDRIDVVGFERDFTKSCEPDSDLGYVLLLVFHTSHKSGKCFVVVHRLCASHEPPSFRNTRSRF